MILKKSHEIKLLNTIKIIVSMNSIIQYFFPKVFLCHIDNYFHEN